MKLLILFERGFTDIQFNDKENNQKQIILVILFMVNIVSRTLYKKENYVYFLLLHRACNTA